MSFSSKILTRLIDRICIPVVERIVERTRFDHGWEVELRCPECGKVAPPVFKGIDLWVVPPTMFSKFGFAEPSTIFAKIHCSKCDADLKEAAGNKLVELFEDIAIPQSNRNAIWGAAILNIPLIIYLVSTIRFDGHMEWGWLDWLILAILASSAVGFGIYIHSLPRHCDCGSPSYKFMGLVGRSNGLLGHSHCFRCSTCGKLLRIRC